MHRKPGDSTSPHDFRTAASCCIRRHHWAAMISMAHGPLRQRYSRRCEHALRAAWTAAPAGVKHTDEAEDCRGGNTRAETGEVGEGGTSSSACTRSTVACCTASARSSRAMSMLELKPGRPRSDAIADASVKFCGR